MRSARSSPVCGTQGDGAIVNVSSTAGKRPSARHAGLQRHEGRRALALASRGGSLRRATGSAATRSRPGPTLSPAWLADGGLADQAAGRSGKSREEVLEASRRAARSAGSRSREEIAAVIVFLCSEPGVLRDRRGLERGRRHRPGDPLTWVGGGGRRHCRRRVRGGGPRGGGAPAVAARRALVRDGRPSRSPRRSAELRTPFQRDRDRILHSKPFRRLKGKTQVFIDPAGDHYRTRMTHTLETTGIARASRGRCA